MILVLHLRHREKLTLTHSGGIELLIEQMTAQRLCFGW